MSPTVSATPAGDILDTDIPYGWVEYFDPASKLPYYHNVILNKTQWNKPQMVDPPSTASTVNHNSEYVEKAYFSKDSGRFSGTTSYWQKVNARLIIH